MSALISNSTHSAAVRPAKIADISVNQCFVIGRRASGVEKRPSARRSPRSTVRQNVSHSSSNFVYDPIHYLPLLERKIGALNRQHGDGRAVRVVVILSGVGPGIGVELG